VEADIAGLAPAWLASLSPEFAFLRGIDLELSGNTSLRFDADGDLRDGHLHLGADKAQVALPGLFPAPLDLASLAADLRMQEFGARWDLERLELAFPEGASATVKGRVRRYADGGKATLTVTAADLQTETLKAAWPIPVSPPAREWIMENIHRGRIPQFEATITGDVGPIGTPPMLSDVQVDGRMPLRDVVLTYWEPLPKATGVSAEGRITERFFEATNVQGESGGMQVSGGYARITGIDKGKGHEVLDLQIDVEGRAGSLLEILNREPLQFAEYLDVAPSTVGGRISGRLNVKLRPVAELTLDDVDISASGQTSGVVLPDMLAGQDVGQADLALHVDKRNLRLEGDAAIGNLPVGLSAHIPFTEQSGYRSQYRLTGRADNQARAKLGLAADFAQPPLIDGVVGFDLTATEQSDGRTILDLDFNLADAGLLVEPAGWEKPKGEFAAGTARFRLDGQQLQRLETFELAGPGLNIDGNADWPRGPDRRPVVRLTSLKLGGGTDLALVARPMEGGAYEVELGPGRLDLQPLTALTGEKAVDAPSGGQEQESAVPVWLKFEGPSVQVRDGPPFENVRGVLAIHGEHVLDADLRGAPGGVGKAHVRLSPHGDLRLTASDAGAFIATLGMPGRIRGGTLEVAGTASPDLSRIDTNIAMKDFTLLDAPLMMRVLQLASITGPLELLLGPSGLQMTAFEAPVSLKDKRITIKNGHVYGGSLGVTMRGDIDLPTELMELNGAVVPAYVLNRLLGSMPVVGDILTGGEGIFAVSYSVTGPYSAPEVKIHPLSILAPGGLRRLLTD